MRGREKYKTLSSERCANAKDGLSCGVYRVKHSTCVGVELTGAVKLELSPNVHLPNVVGKIADMFTLSAVLLPVILVRYILQLYHVSLRLLNCFLHGSDSQP